QVGEKVEIKLTVFVGALRTPQLIPEHRKLIAVLVRRRSGVSSSDLCELLEIAHDRFDQRAERILDAYLVARDEDRTLIRWLGGRSENDLPSPDQLEHKQKVDLIHRFTALLAHTANTPNIRTEIARRMHRVGEKTGWSLDDFDIVRAARDELLKAGMTAEAD